MKNTVLVVAPHPDDETLGCGGTLLRHRDEGDDIHWLIVTGMHESAGHDAVTRADREKEIASVSKAYGFASVSPLGLPTTRLDTIPLADLVKKMGEIFLAVKPRIVYLPNRSDAHTDHRIVFDAASACTKWFRYPFVQKILAYETLSETEAAIAPDQLPFQPNVFRDITRFLDAKIDILNLYKKETAPFPFPRSEKTIRALAAFRGTTAGFEAAEGFTLLRDKS